MATVTFTISAGVVSKLNAIAVAKGFANAKAMVVDFLRNELLSAAYKDAYSTARVSAEASADTDAGAIS